jgi:dTDP-glucose pyrophosphorylase/CBS domain-containing protein
LSHRLTLTEDTSIWDALKLLDRMGSGLLPVVDAKGTLLGVISDGDVRKSILRGQLNLENVINKTPLTFSYSQPRKKAIAYLKSIRRRQLPLVDEHNRLKEMLLLDDLDFEIHSNPVVLMAGGLGTRLGDLTKNAPKPMLPVGNKPIIEALINDFSSQGFRNIYISVNYLADKIKNYFQDGSCFGVQVSYLEESHPMGTAGSLNLMNPRPTQPTIVTNGDIVTSVDFDELLRAHNQSGADATLCVREYEWRLPFGLIHENGGEFLFIEEKPIQRYRVNAGIYIIPPFAFDLMQDDQFLDMTELFMRMKKHGLSIRTHLINDFWLDIGQVDTYKSANKAFEGYL